MRAAVLVLAACGATTPPALTSTDRPAGQLADGRVIEVGIEGDRIGTVTPAAATAWLWPPVVDSHVHLAYWPVADELARTGVAVAVDLAAPERTLDDTRGLHVLSSGPMLTAVHGYPLTSWGSDGYGIGCDDTACVTAAIDRLAGQGVRVVKLALDATGLPPALVPHAVTTAHARGLRVAVHALSDAAARLAADAGADLLAHTPIEPLADATVEAWRGRAVISTLAAFGGDRSTIDNLRRLRAAGVTVLYGTDLGNTRELGVNPDELALLAAAGLDDAAIVDAMTTAPLAYWQVPLGRFEPGAEATFLQLDVDPRTDARSVLTPRGVWLRGERVR